MPMGRSFRLQNSLGRDSEALPIQTELPLFMLVPRPENLRALTTAAPSTEEVEWYTD